MNTPGTMTKIGAATQILHGIGAPVNQHTVGAMVGWMNAEGGNWANNAAYNPLNTTLTTKGARTINGAGVKAYGNWGEGIAATVQTLKQPNMSGIVQAFHNGDPQGVIHAIGSSPWGTSGSTVAQTISSALGQRYAIPSAAGVARSMSSPGTPSTPGLSPITQTEPGTTSTDWGSALTDALLNSSAGGTDTSGKVTVKNPLGDAIHLVDTGAYTSTSPSTTATLSPGVAGTAGAAATRAAAAGPSGQPGARVDGSRVVFSKAVQQALARIGNQERTDSGLDFGAPGSGSAVPAVEDGKIISVHNWGGPYGIGHAGGIVYQTKDGKVYVMEDFLPLGSLKPGMTIRAGQRIGTAYGQIETGWANPQGTNALQGSANPTQSGIGFTLASGFRPINTAHQRVPGYGIGAVPVAQAARTRARR